MDQKKLNKCIAMALLRQCALVWEHCMAFSNPVVECTLNFSDIRKCMGKDGHKTETGLHPLHPRGDDHRKEALRQVPERRQHHRLRPAHRAHGLRLRAGLQEVHLQVNVSK